MAEPESHPLTDDTTANEILVKKPTSKESEPTKPRKREGCSAPWIWFKEAPMTRWQFGVFLLFTPLCIIWALIRIGSSLSGDIIAGVCALILAIYGAHHFRILLGLKAEIDRFAENNENFKFENVKLKTEVNKLSKAHDELSAIRNRLQETTKKYAENINEFRNLDETLSKLSVDNIDGIEKLKEMSQRIQNSMHNELLQHERDILHKVMNAMEFGDDKVGMNEDEYNKFITALPTTFQRRFSMMKKTFVQISGDDGILDIEEFGKLADQFAEQEAAAGGSHY